MELNTKQSAVNAILAMETEVKTIEKALFN